MQLYEPELERLIGAAFSTLRANLHKAGSVFAQHVLSWFEAIHADSPEVAYQHPTSYPMLLFPWWTAKSFRAQPDLELQTDLIYSTVNGYYTIRMIDNLMDGHATRELELLPALNFFYTEYQRPYQHYFAPAHPFWDYFTATWYTSAAVTIQDAQADSIDHDHFMHITAQKTCAVKIPIAAVCYRYERPDLIQPWTQLVDLFSCWHQMYNDVFDWRKDLELQTNTYFLSEAARQKAPEESVAEWVARAGFVWGMERLTTWMAQLQAISRELSPDALAYLQARETMLAEKQAQIRPGLQSTAHLLALLRQACPSR